LKPEGAAMREVRLLCSPLIQYLEDEPAGGRARFERGAHLERGVGVGTSIFRSHVTWKLNRRGAEPGCYPERARQGMVFDSSCFRRRAVVIALPAIVAQ
jgi:hypothetical protein